MAARDRDELQPLHAAVLACQPGTVAVLLDAGADPRAACPDVYPHLAKWQAHRSMQTMQVGQPGGRASYRAEAAPPAALGAGAALMAGLTSVLRAARPTLPPPQAAMLEEGMPADLMAPLLAMMGMGAGGDMPPEDATLTAVDLACCVARHIPTVEAFVQRGVRPSEEALRLGEHAVPIMRCGGGAGGGLRAGGCTAQASRPALPEAAAVLQAQVLRRQPPSTAPFC